MFRRILTILALLLTALSEVSAQYDPSFSHYWAMETSFNPGAVGKQEKINIVGAYNMSLTGFEHNPRTMYASGDMPFVFLGATHGVGALFVNDAIGLFSHRILGLQYALKKRLFGGVLSVGVDGALLSESFDGSELDVVDSGDPALLSSEVTGSAFDLGAGLYYQHKHWYVGVSAMHLLAPMIDLGETSQLSVARSYYFTAGCNIRFKNPFLSLHPSVMGRSDAIGYRADVTARLKYTHEKRVMYVGVGYSPTNSVTVMIGGNFHGISLGYSYEIYTNGISLGMGSHELCVGYQMDVNLTKKGRNRHQSVRIL